MYKTSTENQTIHDYFSGTGDVTVDAASAVERLMVKIFENLFARGYKVEDLKDGRVISETLMHEYYIAVSADDARNYFERWVQEVRNKMKW